LLTASANATPRREYTNARIKRMTFEASGIISFVQDISKWVKAVKPATLRSAEFCIPNVESTEEIDCKRLFIFGVG
jgi:uncharacterized lipoprotein YddW (UPF0748 family)